MLRQAARLVPLAAAVSLGCGPEPEPKPGSGAARVAGRAEPSQGPLDAGIAPDAGPDPSPTDAVLLITERAALAELEQAGLSVFGVLLAGKGEGLGRLAKQSAIWRDITKTLDQDIRAYKYRDRLSGVGMKYAHRLFDTRWLKSNEARLELVAVVNRLDRQPFTWKRCGEVRLVYRLAYSSLQQGMKVESRLPLTLNVVFFQSMSEQKTCVEPWRAPGATEVEKARWLLREGVLKETLVGESLADLKSVEVNMQSVRWPSTLRPNMAGHAEYVLRVFKANEEGAKPSLLENTPDLAKIGAREKGLLKTYLRSNLERLDDGILVTPEGFLADKIVSVAPHAMGRLKNRVWSQIFTPKDLESLAPQLKRHKTISTPAALLRRLDALTCAGCHQSRSVGGFHMLGVDDPQKRVDALHVAFSAHVTDELEQRKRFIESVAQGSFDRYRASAELPRTVGRWGDRCGIAEDFEGHTCGPGLRCRHVGDDELGVCVSGDADYGDPCETGKLSQTANASRDVVSNMQRQSCGAGRVCERNGVGFPDGLCAGGCGNLGEHGTCGGIPLLVGFNQCLAGGVPFESCILDNLRPGVLRRCDATHACRDDYVCATTPKGAGGCMPPYFLFQLRVDGHPQPG